MPARLDLRVLAAVVALGPIFLALTRAASADPTLGDFSTFELVSSQAVSPVVTEFEYRIPLTADLQDLAGASVAVTSVSSATTIVDGSLSFGPIAAGATQFSTDTFSLQHHRGNPFHPSVLRFTLTIFPANHPPVADAGPDQTVFVNDSVVLDGSGSTDIDGDLLSFAWSFVSRPAGSGAVLVSPTDVTTGFDVDLPGTYVVQLIVDDGIIDSAADTVVIDTENSPPVAHAGPDQTVLVTDVVGLDGSGSSDVDFDPLSFHWSFLAVPAGSTASLSDPAATAPTFVVDLSGTYVVQLIVNDGTIDSAPDTVVIDTGNSPPIADAGPDQTVFVFDTVNLDGSGSRDVDFDPLTFRWSFTSVPPGSAAVLDDATAITPSFVADVPGRYVVQLIVNDGTVDGAPDTVVIDTENSPPLADAGPDQTVAIGASVQLDGSPSSDPEGTPLQFSWDLTSKPAGSAAVLSNETSATPAFVADLPGLYVVELVVSDGVLESAPDVAAVTAQIPLVSVDATDANAAEAGADPGTFTITRTGPTAAPLVVDYTIAGSATNGTDYAAIGYTYAVMGRTVEARAS